MNNKLLPYLSTSGSFDSYVTNTNIQVTIGITVGSVPITTSSSIEFNFPNQLTFNNVTNQSNRILVS